jgi:hypothetical protein
LHIIPRDTFFDKFAVPLFSAILLISNLFVVLSSELAHDEAYYWMFSKNLDWGYFDHPPMMAWLIRLTSWIPGELGVRAGYLVGLQLSGYLLSKMVPSENKWLVWLALNIFPLLSFSGIYAIPDGPLVFFSIVWLWSLKKSLENDSLKNASVVGIATALLFYSKYHGVLFIVGTLIALPKLLLRRNFWISLVVGLIVFAPHVYWQWIHEFATFKYHFIDRPKVEFSFKQPLEFLAIQLFLPGIFLAPILWHQFFKTKASGEFEKTLKVITFFSIVFFFMSTFNKKMEANWTVASGISFILYLTLQKNNFRNSKVSLSLGLLSLAIVLASKALFIFPNLIQVKRLSEFHGWKNWSLEIKEECGNLPIVANTYQIASKLSFYLDEDVPALNIQSRLNQFEFWDQEQDLMSEEVCWVAKQKIVSGLISNTPDGKKVVLVKEVKLNDIMMYKKRSL